MIQPTDLANALTSMSINPDLVSVGEPLSNGINLGQEANIDWSEMPRILSNTPKPIVITNLTLEYYQSLAKRDEMVDKGMAVFNTHGMREPILIQNFNIKFGDVSLEYYTAFGLYVLLAEWSNFVTTFQPLEYKPQSQWAQYEQVAIYQAEERMHSVIHWVLSRNLLKDIKFDNTCLTVATHYLNMGEVTVHASGLKPMLDFYRTLWVYPVYKVKRNIKRGARFRHKTGEVYVILEVTNVDCEREDFVETVVYCNNEGKIYSKPITDWKMALVSEPPKYNVDPLINQFTI